MIGTASAGWAMLACAADTGPFYSIRAAWDRGDYASALRLLDSLPTDRQCFETRFDAALAAYYERMWDKARDELKVVPSPSRLTPVQTAKIQELSARISVTEAAIGGKRRSRSEGHEDIASQLCQANTMTGIGPEHMNQVVHGIFDSASVTTQCPPGNQDTTIRVGSGSVVLEAADQPSGKDLERLAATKSCNEAPTYCDPPAALEIPDWGKSK